MLDWKIVAIIAPLTFAIYQSLAKLLPKETPALLVSAYAFFVGFLLMLILHFAFSLNKTLILNTKSLFIAIGAGILLSLGNYGVIKAFNLGAPQSLFAIIFYITLLIYGVIFGFLFWRETLSIPQILGTILAIAGIVIVFYFKK